MITNTCSFLHYFVEKESEEQEKSSFSEKGVFKENPWSFGEEIPPINLLDPPFAT